MSQVERITRRSAMGRVAAGATAAVASALTEPGAKAGESKPDPRAEAGRRKLKGRIQQSVCKWCYPQLSVEELVRGAAKIGIAGIDLIRPPDWGTAFKYGIRPVMGYVAGGSPPDGLNQKANHPKFEKECRTNIDLAAKAGVPNLICFSGNRRGISDEEGLENCYIFLKKVIPQAEDKDIMICMEPLNSKIDHPDYQCDHTAWGVELVKRVNSPRFRLLHDIYHMQIMEGDVIRTIRDNIPYIAHFHTGGVPGRNEIDKTQELNYATITQAIIETGFSGYMAHEFIPKRDPLASLAEAALLCDV